MVNYDFAAHLVRHGPHRRNERRLTLNASRLYCRRLAQVHYENFTVASCLLPRHLRQHFCNLYAYCRWADDLADECGDQGASGRLLDWWEGQLGECFRGRATHPVFVALRETIDEFELPREPFGDLLVAFRQDQTVTRYETCDDLLAYCRHSANPVGRLVLRLGRCYNEATVRLADSICTGLQLANFCQDVARDYERGRIYLPQQSCRRFGYEEGMFERRQWNPPFRELLAHEVDRAEAYLTAGWPLIREVHRDLKIAVELFLRGGQAMLRAIRRIDYDVWRQRPMVSRWTKLRLLGETCFQAHRLHP